MFSDMNMASKSTWARYGTSKLAKVLQAKELAVRYGQKEKCTLLVSLHPGTVKTGLSAGPRDSTPLYEFIQPLAELGAPGSEKACWNTLWCAASTDLCSAGYFLPI